MKALDGKNVRPNLQHAIERVERPGGSHEGVGRKKNLPHFRSDRLPCDAPSHSGCPSRILVLLELSPPQLKV